MSSSTSSSFINSAITVSSLNLTFPYSPPEDNNCSGKSQPESDGAPEGIPTFRRTLKDKAWLESPLKTPENLPSDHEQFLNELLLYDEFANLVLICRLSDESSFISD